MNEIIKHAFVEELDKIAETEELTELQKEAILGVKSLMMGARRLGSGIAGKAKAGLIKAQVGVQKAQLAATKAVGNIAAKPSRGAGGKFTSPSKVKKWFRAKTKDTSKLESSIAANTEKARQTSQVASAKIKGTGTAVKRTWNVEKQDTRAFFDNIKRRRKIKQKVKMKKDTAAINSADASAPPPINTKPKIDTSAPKPKVDKTKKPKKEQGMLDWVGAGIVGKDSKNKTLAGGAALLGGGYMASNMMSGATQKPAEQGIFFKSSELNKTASLGGTILGSLTKEANPKMKALKMVGGGAAVGAGAGYLANDALEPDNEARMKSEAKDAFKATFPDLPGPDADNMFEQVWSKYQKNQKIQLSKAVIQGASEAQKFGSFVGELSKEANVAALGKIVAKIGYGAGRMLAGGKHLGNLQKAKKLTNLQRVGMSAMKNRKMVGTGIVAAGGGYALGRNRNQKA